jgi:predicted outer membrane repeat protein
MKVMARMALLIGCLMVWGTMATSTAWAAGVVGTGTPGSCESNDVQEALEGGGMVVFNCGASPHTIEIATFVIEDDTTINGANLITLDGENLRQLFIVNNGVTLTLLNIILLDGEFGSGGCISIDTGGTLITDHVTFRSCRNTSTSLGGGAIYNLGTFTATDTIFIQNEAAEEGGAILNRGRFHASFVTFEANTAADDSGAIENDTDGIALIEDSIFLGNQAGAAGGAVGNTLSFPVTDGSLTIRRTLFEGNTAATFGGAINNVTGSITIQNSTFVENKADEGGALYSTGSTNTTITFSTFDHNMADLGGAIYRPLTGEVNLGYSIVAGSRNEADTSDELECDGPALDSQGYNLIEDGSCVGSANSTDIRNTAPNLGPLQDNGGFSKTEMPDAGSPALGKVPAGQCIARDQRFAKRSGACDIGAVERGGLTESAYLPRLRKQ